MRSTSPRRTAPGQTLTPSPSTTSPMTVASGCTNTCAPKTGTLSWNAWIDIGRQYTGTEGDMEFVHVATRTKDLDKAIAFYEALGMSCSRKSELTKNKATLAFMEPPEGNFAIELVYNWGKDTPYDGGERFGHFAFDVEDIDTTY
ncbi:MAG: hypothetical protein EHM52_02945, partial [Actinomycetota bacterium]